MSADPVTEPPGTSHPVLGLVFGNRELAGLDRLLLTLDRARAEMPAEMNGRAASWPS